MDVAQVLVLVLSIPLVSLLLFVLTVMETRLLGDPARTHLGQRTGHAADHMSSEHHWLVRRPAGRLRQQRNPFGEEQAGTAAGRHPVRAGSAAGPR